MFGKRNRPAQPAQTPQPAASGAGGGPHLPSDDTRFPWSDASAKVACNLAAGNLANNLVSWVAQDGRVHAETYVAAAGAIAGYAAQRSLLAQHGGSLPADVQAITIGSGEKYLFGDPLNAMLFARNDADAAGRVWPRAASAAVHAGLPVSRLPSLDDMFGHVSETLGGPLEGRPSTGANHQPAAPARQLLALFWPHAATLFRADFDDLHRRFGPVPQHWWYAVAAYTMSRPITDVKDALPPAIALTILMESAIYASKLTRF